MTSLYVDPQDTWNEEEFAKRLRASTLLQTTKEQGQQLEDAVGGPSALATMTREPGAVVAPQGDSWATAEPWQPSPQVQEPAYTGPTLDVSNPTPQGYTTPAVPDPFVPGFTPAPAQASPLPDLPFTNNPNAEYPAEYAKRIEPGPSMADKLLSFSGFGAANGQTGDNPSLASTLTGQSTLPGLANPLSIATNRFNLADPAYQAITGDQLPNNFVGNAARVATNPLNWLGATTVPGAARAGLGLGESVVGSELASKGAEALGAPDWAQKAAGFAGGFAGPAIGSRLESGVQSYGGPGGLLKALGSEERGSWDAANAKRQPPQGAHGLSYEELLALSKKSGIGIGALRGETPPLELLDREIANLEKRGSYDTQAGFSQAQQGANQKGTAMRLNALRQARESIAPTNPVSFTQQEAIDAFKLTGEPKSFPPAEDFAAQARTRREGMLKQIGLTEEEFMALPETQRLYRGGKGISIQAMLEDLTKAKKATPPPPLTAADEAMVQGVAKPENVTVWRGTTSSADPSLGAGTWVTTSKDAAQRYADIAVQEAAARGETVTPVVTQHQVPGGALSESHPVTGGKAYTLTADVNAPSAATTGVVDSSLRAAEGAPARGATQEIGSSAGAPPATPPAAGQGSGGQPPLPPVTSASGGATAPPIGPPAAQVGSQPPLLGNTSNAIVDAFKKKQAESTAKMGATNRTAGVGGDLADPYLSEVVNNEKALKHALIKNETDKMPAVDVRGLNATDKADAVAQLHTKLQNVVDQADRLTEGFRKDVVNSQYKTVAERETAAQTLAANDAYRAAHGQSPFDQAQGILKEMVLGADFGVAGQQGLKVARVGSTSLVSSVIGHGVDRLSKALGRDPDALGVYTNPAISHEAEAAANGLITQGASAVGLNRGEVTGGIKRGVGGAIADKLLPEGENLAKSAALAVPRTAGAAVQGLSNVQYGLLAKVRTQIYEGRLYQEKLLGHDISQGSESARRAAEFANMATSTARTASDAGRAMAESRYLLSPQMTRSQFAEMAAPLKTFRSQADALNTANQLLSTAATFGTALALQKQFGVPMTAQQFLQTVANPNDPNFGKMTLKEKNSDGENIVWNFLPQFSAENAILKSLRATVDASQGDKGAQQALTDVGKALGTYGLGRLNTGFSDLAKVGGFGYDDSGHFYWGDMPAGAKVKGIAPIPLSAQSALQGNTDTTSVAANLLGGNTYGQGTPKTRDQARDEVATRMGLGSYRDATEKQQREIDDSPTVAPLVAKAQQESAARGSVLSQNSIANAVDRQQASSGEGFQGTTSARETDIRLAQGAITGEQARQNYDDLDKALAIAASTRASTPEAKAQIADLEKNKRDLTKSEQAQLDYYAIFDKPGVQEGSGALNYPAYQAALADWQKAHPDFSKEDVSPAKPLSPGHADLQAARVELRPYFQLQDQAWKDAQKTDPLLAKYPDEHAYIVGETIKMRDEGLPEEIARKIATAEVAGATQFGKLDQIFYLIDHPEAITRLRKWYSVPAGLDVLDPTY